jgi:hypothetical protein
LHELDGRIGLLGVLVLFFAATFAAMPSPSFLDLRVVTSGWDCAHRGVDVLVTNPCDPYGVIVNQPRVWDYGYLLGLGSGQTVALGVLLVIAFFVSVLWLVHRLMWFEAIVYTVILVSPPVWLAIDRANLDVLMFVLLCGALAVFRRHPKLGSAILYLPAFLKLFPAFAFALALRSRRRIAVLTSGLLAAAFVAYLFAMGHDLHRILAGTQHFLTLSYGAPVLVKGLARGLGLAPVVAAPRALMYAAVFTAVVGGSFLVIRWLVRDAGGLRGADHWREEAFWLGAPVYVGTWAIFDSFDYRLIFLLFVLPLTLEWARWPNRQGRLARWGLVTIIGALWTSDAYSSRFHIELFPIDELLNMAIVVYVVAGLILTLPAWLAPRPIRRLSCEPWQTDWRGGREPSPAHRPRS